MDSDTWPTSDNCMCCGKQIDSERQIRKPGCQCCDDCEREGKKVPVGVVEVESDMDWIDEEYRDRKEGHTRALAQDQHAAVNARYPGCTLEYCFECGEATGNAGPGDGSLYDDDGNGPFCDACFDAANG